MKTITLPDGLLSENVQPIQVYDYHSSQEIAKQQIILHQHTFSFLIEGSKEVLFDNSALSIDNSQFLVMKSGHCLMTEKLSEVRHYRSLLLFFSNETLFRFMQKNKLHHGDSTEQTSVFSFAYDAFIQRFVESLMDISKISNHIKGSLIEVKFEEIMLYLTGIYGTGFLQALLANSDDTAQHFTRIVERNTLNRLTLRELAFLCHMSVSTFKREFEKHYSESPIKWFQHKRLEHAHYLLNQKQKSSSEVYFEVGYENLSSFIQAYKAKYGITPKQHQNH